jgi:hypothetical protein
VEAEVLPLPDHASLSRPGGGPAAGEVRTARGAGSRIAAGGVAVALGALLVGALWAAFLTLLLLLLVGGMVPAGAGCASDLAASMPAGPGALVAATVYSEPGPGAYGAGLGGHLSFAELGLHAEGDGDRSHADRIGRALGLGGPLAPFTRLEIRAPNGRTVVAEKRDVGMGGAPIDGHARAIDLWTTTREALGLPPDWSGLVRVSGVPGEALATEAGAPPGDGQRGVSRATSPETGCGPGSVPASEAGARIVRIARSQLGVGEHPPGSNCTSYGPCEPWCALFATWVWRRAGVRIPQLGFSGAIYEWAQRAAHVFPAGAPPQPGWAALIGSGPADAATSVHVAIVESVLPDGAITLINGNFADRVMRTGPCLPRRAQFPAPDGCEEPGPIYAYAAPE